MPDVLIPKFTGADAAANMRNFHLAYSQGVRDIRRVAAVAYEAEYQARRAHVSSLLTCLCCLLLTAAVLRRVQNLEMAVLT